MTVKSKIHSLLLPSLSSSILIGSISMFIVVSSAWSIFKNTSFMQEYLSANSSQSLSITQQSGSFDAINSAIFSSRILNEILYISVWATIGMLCYFIGVICISGTANIRLILQVSEKSQFSANGKYALYEAITRVVFRLFMFILLLLFTIFFMQVIIPIAVLIIKAGSEFSSLASGIYLLSGTLLLVLYMHVMLITLRLTYLRVRVFGAVDEIILDR